MQYCQRAYSIRTRIKTREYFPLQNLQDCQRAYSIRTRIKTPFLVLHKFRIPFVREHIPLEQGLRRMNFYSCATIQFVREHIPLEQGLRLYIVFIEYR